MSLEKGTKLGPYEILSALGTGGMGEVYRARDPRLERDVAIKVLPDQVSQDISAMARFQHENKMVAALSHPNIRVIYDIGSDKGRTFAVMELLEGMTLGDCLQNAAFDWREAVRISMSVAQGLAAAHSKGIVHRDIKPENIFITEEGEIKILDFGLAHSLGPDLGDGNRNTTLTNELLPEVFAGTVPYMSPEQVRSEPADARSDIFAFGCVLYEMLTGKRLFARNTAAETVAAILHDNPPHLKDAGISIPEELQRLLNLCLAKDQAHRLQSMSDVIVLLMELTQDPTTRKQVHPASVAVLPFVNMSASEEDEYFSDGLTEELINSLVKIGGLQVASRTTSALFKGKSQDIRMVGEQLSVKTVMEGSIRRAGNRFRISAQLINAKDGYHLWSETFDREVEDVLAVQGEIAEQIAQALQIVLTDKEKHAIAKAPTENVEAYDYCLQGRQYFYRFQRKGFDQALKLFLHAIELDPEYAGAYAWASYCYAFLYTWFDSSSYNLTEAEKASRKALSLDKDLAEAHVARGMVLSIEKKMSQAQKEFETAVRLKPDLYEASYFFARLYFQQGKLKEAVDLASKATRQRPDDYNAPSLLAMIYFDLERRDEATSAYQLCLQRVHNFLELFPDDARARYVGASALIRLGQKQQALEWTELVMEGQPQEPMTLYGVACNFAMLGRPDKAVSCLERALLFGTLPKSWLENDPDLDPLRGRPRFQAFLARLNDK